jgi:hypothetical protein
VAFCEWAFITVAPLTYINVRRESISIFETAEGEVVKE